MPSPNKYHSSGARYSVNKHPRAVSAKRYIVRGYVHPRLSFQWYSEQKLKPLNLGIKKANRIAESLGMKFNKAQYLELRLKG